MIEFSKLYFFLGASLALLLVPGPAVLYITARSANQGRLAGRVSVLAIEVFGRCLSHLFGDSKIVRPPGRGREWSDQTGESLTHLLAGSCDQSA